MMIDLRQIKGGLALKQLVDQLNTSYDAAKVLIDGGENVKSAVERLTQAVADVNTAVGTKADQAYVDAELAKKANMSDVEAALEGKADEIHTHEASDIVEDETHRFVTDEEKAKWNQKVTGVSLEEDMLKVDVNGAVEETKVITKYTSDVPSTVAVGGLAKGFTAADGINIEELIFSMLHQYVAPGASCSANPNGGVYELGHRIPNVNLTGVGRREAEKIKSVVLKVNNVEAARVDNETLTGNVTCNHTITDLASNTTTKVEVNDGKQTVSANGPTFTFVHPIYTGKLAADKTAPTGAEIKALSKQVVNVSQRVVNFTCNNERMVIAVPSNWTLKSAIDPNKFDMTGSFALVRTDVECLDGSTQSYKVYMSAPTNQTNFAVTFNF